MTTVTRCDRCGSIYDEFEHFKKVKGLSVNVIDVWNTKTKQARTHDLCPKCIDDLNEWFKEILREKEESNMVLSELEITDVQSYVDDEGLISNIIVAQRGGTKVRFVRPCLDDNESDKIVPGAKINLSVSFRDPLNLLL